VASKTNKFGYAELEGKMLDVQLVVTMDGEMLVKMQYTKTLTIR